MAQCEEKSIISMVFGPVRQPPFLPLVHLPKDHVYVSPPVYRPFPPVHCRSRKRGCDHLVPLPPRHHEVLALATENKLPPRGSRSCMHRLVQRIQAILSKVSAGLRYGGLRPAFRTDTSLRQSRYVSFRTLTGMHHSCQLQSIYGLP